MTDELKKKIGNIPSWIITAIIILVGFIGSWKVYSYRLDQVEIKLNKLEQINELKIQITKLEGEINLLKMQNNMRNLPALGVRK